MKWGLILLAGAGCVWGGYKAYQGIKKRITAKKIAKDAIDEAVSRPEDVRKLGSELLGGVMDRLNEKKKLDNQDQDPKSDNVLDNVFEEVEDLIKFKNDVKPLVELANNGIKTTKKVYNKACNLTAPLGRAVKGTYSVAAGSVGYVAQKGKDLANGVKNFVTRKNENEEKAGMTDLEQPKVESDEEVELRRECNVNVVIDPMSDFKSATFEPPTKKSEKQDNESKGWWSWTKGWFGYKN